MAGRTQAHAQVPPAEMLLDLCQMTDEILARIPHAGREATLTERTEMTLRMVARRHSTHPDHRPAWVLGPTQR